MSRFMQEPQPQSNRPARLLSESEPAKVEPNKGRVHFFLSKFTCVQSYQFGMIQIPCVPPKEFAPMRFYWIKVNYLKASHCYPTTRRYKNVISKAYAMVSSCSVHKKSTAMPQKKFGAVCTLSHSVHPETPTYPLNIEKKHTFDNWWILEPKHCWIQTRSFRFLHTPCFLCKRSFQKSPVERFAVHYRK